ncbi:hypothetical protein BN1723_013145 [Verticillium longisporum]|uniref:Uncharacterized protein n=1 Tax=Verticillium longisporum TaxID=100787 RepID=A0A0G4LPJ0_VERLO|nr:hypothetical protein BN1708_010080 [Verticillium longisporum]CRK23844.1 hypothetical protein BN1723_013145 [Verticillium longisporum]
MDKVSLAVFTARIDSEGEQIYILNQALEKELQALEEVGGRGNIQSTLNRTHLLSCGEFSRSTILAGHWLRPCSRRRLTALGNNGGHSSAPQSPLFIDITSLTWILNPPTWYLIRTKIWFSLMLAEPVALYANGCRLQCTRKENDTWAVGKVLSKMAEAQEQEDGQQQLLRSVAEKAMGDPAQASLSRIAANLSRSHR